MDPESRAVTSFEDVSWAPLPNVLTCVLGRSAPEPVTSVMMLIVCEDHLLLVCVADRGWDLPGGHLEEGESPHEAARRELFEEAGLLLPAAPKVHGWLHLVCSGELPPGYLYPRESAMLARTADLPGPPPVLAPQLVQEVLSARWVPLVEVPELCAGRVWLPLLQ